MDKILYKHKKGDVWNKIRTDTGFYPRDNDFDFLMFEIDGELYTKPSDKFYEEYNKILMWYKLKHDMV